MSIVEHSILINRPVEEVFGFMTDFRNDPVWQPDVVDVHQTEGKTRVGTMVTERRNVRALFYLLDLNADVIEVKPNRKVEYKGVMGLFPFTASYSFEPTGLSTKVTEIIDLHVWGLHRIFGGLVTGSLKRRTERTLTNLKSHLESKPRT